MNNDFEFQLYTRLAEQRFEDFPKFRGVISHIDNNLECRISLTKHQNKYLYYPIKRLYNFSLSTYFETLFPDMFFTFSHMDDAFYIGYEDDRPVMPGELDLWLKPFGEITHIEHDEGDYIKLKLKYELRNLVY